MIGKPIVFGQVQIRVVLVCTSLVVAGLTLAQKSSHSGFSFSMDFLTKTVTYFVVLEPHSYQPNLLKMPSSSKGRSKPSHMNDLSFLLLGLKISVASLLYPDLMLFHGFPNNLMTFEL